MANDETVEETPKGHALKVHHLRPAPGAKTAEDPGRSR